MKASPFRPLVHIDGHLALEDHGLIGDGTTAGLVGRDGAVVWLCVPRFDSSPLFCQILDHVHGGVFSIAAEGAVESRQFYEDESGVLTTEIRTPSGLVRLTDALTLRSGSDLREDRAAGRSELLRKLVVVNGPVSVTITIDPRGGAAVEPRAGGFRLRPTAREDLDLQLSASVPLTGLRTTLVLQTGAIVYTALSWAGGRHRHETLRADESLRATVRAWDAWTRNIVYDGPQTWLVRRSAITLKLLDHFENGAKPILHACRLRSPRSRR